MKLINLFEETDDIDTILHSHYTIEGDYKIENGVVNVYGVCKLSEDYKVRNLMIKFGKVSTFNCTENELTSLKGSPSEVIDFNCSHNNLTSLKGSPQIVSGRYGCNSNKLTSLEGAPEHIGSEFYAYGNPLTSLIGLPKSIGGSIGISYNEDLPLLRLCFVKGLRDLAFLNPSNYVVEDIMNKYVGKGKGAALQCAVELIKAGFKQHARL